MSHYRRLNDTPKHPSEKGYGMRTVRMRGPCGAVVEFDPTGASVGLSWGGQSGDYWTALDHGLCGDSALPPKVVEWLPQLFSSVIEFES